MGSSSSTITRKISFDNHYDFSLLSPPNNVAYTKTMKDDYSTSIIISKNKEEDLSLPVKQVPTSGGDDFYIISENYNDPNSIDQMAMSGDDYWPQRIENLKKVHHELNDIIENEYHTTLANAHKLFDQSEAETKALSNKKYRKLKAKIQKCYQENPKRTLACADLVQEFTDALYNNVYK